MALIMRARDETAMRFHRGSKLSWVFGALLVGLPAVAAADSPENSFLSVIVANAPEAKNGLGQAQRWLAEHGIYVGLTYANSVLANLHGGLRRGVIDQGLAQGVLTVDFEKLAGLNGLSLYSNVFQIHNTGRIRRDYVDGINTVDAIEAVPTTRLSELWLEQKLANGAASLRVGQLAADIEFFFAGLSDLFLQSDWPTITAVNLPSGGPAYPLSTPGARLKIDPNENVSLLFAVYNGDPAGPGIPGDEQSRNRYGLNFRVNDPAFMMFEAQFRSNQGNQDTGLARTLKVGGWTHLGTFEDQRFANDGTLLAGGSSHPAHRRGNSGIYGVIEQQLYRPPGGSATSGVSVFSRVSTSPSDRNLIDFYIDGGIVFANMISQRPEDKFGASVIYARFSNGVRAFDRDQIAATGLPGVVRDFEMNLEFTYRAQISAGWTIQPVLTYVWHPEGNSHRNALVSGAKSIWRF